MNSLKQGYETNGTAQYKMYGIIYGYIRPKYKVPVYGCIPFCFSS
jgi:hypothetical protein